MGEFFKELLSQLSTIWEKLSLQQKIIIGSLIVFMFSGLFVLILWSGAGAQGGGDYRVLHRNVATEDMAQITDKLTESPYEYELRNDGRDIYVRSENLYEVRMLLAREGLPNAKNSGYELFDQSSFGMTDFEQNIKARRALEGELTRTITSLDMVRDARVHIVFMESSLFQKEAKKAKASVTLDLSGAKEPTRDQIRGISFLVSSSVEGLARENVSILDSQGRLLSSPYDDDSALGMSSQNIEIQKNVENRLNQRLEELLSRVVGYGNATVTVSADLNFDQIEQNSEIYDPESRVIRSQEINESSVENAPDGDRSDESIVSNYEINRTMEKVIKEVGTVNRLSVSVVVNGQYEENEEGEREFVPRSEEELARLEEAVRNAVGFNAERGDQISVTSMRFDTSFEEGFRAQRQIGDFEINDIINYAIIAAVLIAAVIIIISIARAMADAMNPPLPQVELPRDLQEEEDVVDIPENIARSNDLLEKAEIMAENDPSNVARIIQDWLNEPRVSKEKS
jgi:flagellar M-ring protein FliF